MPSSFREERVKLCFMDDLALYGDGETWKISLHFIKKILHGRPCNVCTQKRDKLRSLGASRLINIVAIKKLLTAEKISLSFFSRGVSNCQ